MTVFRTALKLAGGVLAGLLLALALVFGLLQSGPGKAWLAQRLADALSGPAGQATVTGLHGLVPIDMRVGRMEIADAQGPRITIEDAVLSVAPADLLAGRLRIRELGARTIRVERPSQASGGSTNPAALLHPPVEVVLERLRVDRLELGPALLGEPVALTLVASGTLGGGHAAADLDLHRIDGAAGQATFHLALSGEPLRLQLAGDIGEPSGRLLASLLDRAPLPLTVHLAGDGPLTDWQGRLTAAAGDAAALEANFRVERDADAYRASTQGTARVAALLPPQLQPLFANETRIAAATTITDRAVSLETLTLTAAAGTVSANGKWAWDGDTIAGQATLDLPALAPLAPLLGSDIAGAARAKLSLAGTVAEPTARVWLSGTDLAFAGNRVAQTSATLDLHAAGDRLAAATPIDVTASGRVTRVTLAAAALPGGLGDAIDWRIAGQLDRQKMHATVNELHVESAGNAVAAHGSFAGGDVTGTVHLDVPDVAAFAGATLHGALALDSDVHATAEGAATATLNGTLRRSGDSTSPAEALLGNEATLAAELERQADGTLAARNVTAKAANGAFSGSGSRAADGRLAADYRLELPRLAAIDPRLAGSVSIDGSVSGTEDAPATRMMLRGKKIAVGATHFDMIEAQLDGAGLAQPSGRLDAKFAVEHLDGTASAEGTLSPGDALRLSKVHLDAAGTKLDGALTYRFAAGTVESTLSGTVPDLKPWSALIGTPVAGSAQVKATLGGGKRQTADVVLDGKDLAWGARPATAQRLRVTAHLSDILGKPQGRAELQLDNAKSGSATIEQARLAGRSDRPGRFALEGRVRGSAGAPLDLATSASITIGEKMELSVTRLAGSFGDQAVLLHQPLTASRRGADLALAGLDLGIGGGRLSGNGAAKGNTLSLHLLAETLPVSLFAALGGQPDVTGILDFEVTLSGTRVRPQGDVVIEAEQLRFAAASRPDLPPLGMVASASWRGDRVELKGRLAGPQNAAIGFAGAVPLVLDRKSLAPSLPPRGALAFHVEGDGELANLVDLLPLGEDRVAGHFTVDVSVGGTVGAPDASGQLSLRDGRFESLSYGTILAGVSFDLVGNRDRLVLQRFAASDGERGSLALSGAVNLAAAAGPTFDVGGELKSFRAVRRDEANATASGQMRLTGTVTAPSVAAQLRIDSAELRVPEQLPQTVQPIEVVQINSATGQVLSAPDEQQNSKHVMVVALGITVDLPGQIFVRGRGLDSEWRGRLALNGTSAAPQLTGKLEVVRGSYAFLGKTANLTKGAITFLGGTKIDPAIDIEARVASTDVTAIVQISGTAAQPKIALSSQPELPQDEILSRVLFGSSISQISPAQGLEIAQAAAALATGGGPGVLDKIRQGLGLDRLSFGSAGTSNSALNNLATPSLASQPGIPGSMPATVVGTSPLPVGAGSGSTSAGAAAVSAGKYVANGVYVGVTQGITSGSSSVDVQIDVSKHITLGTTAGQNSGAGVGVDWKLDY